MKLFERYFNRNVLSFESDFSENLSLIVVLPALDEPDLFCTLKSFEACRRTKVKVGVIIVVNHPEDCAVEVKRRNENIYDALLEYTTQISTPNLEFCLIKAFDLPVASSGVGVVRKMAMDAAAWYFYKNGNPDGIIVSTDADTLVEENYFEEIFNCFSKTDVAGVSINYAHVLEDIDASLRHAIIQYELYLRYYSRALRFIGHPYFYSCIGSAFACRVSDYVAQGGMNKRQAGEDFYFLQKLMTTGRFTNLTATTVWPSARISSRTPFGTGQAVHKIMREGGMLQTYNWQAFLELKVFFEDIGSLYKEEGAVIEEYMSKQAPALRAFLEEGDFVQKISEINNNVASQVLFRKRFFDYFNAFRILKYLNFVHVGYWGKQTIEEAVTELFKELKQVCPSTPYEMLLLLRLWDKTGNF